MWSSGVCEEKYSEMGWPRLREWERMCLAKKTHDSTVEGGGVRGRPPSSWESRVGDYSAVATP